MPVVNGRGHGNSLVSWSAECTAATSSDTARSIPSKPFNRSDGMAVEKNDKVGLDIGSAANGSAADAGDDMTSASALRMRCAVAAVNEERGTPNR